MTKKIIPLDEIDWVPSSTVDPAGRVFKWNNDLYRAIRNDHVVFYRELFKRGIFDTLGQDGFLMRNNLTRFSLEGYGLVIEHEKIDYEVYPFEWCGEMFRDAALMMCDLNSKLISLGLEMKDIHPYNIVFRFYNPKFIDIGSIIKLADHSKWSIAKNFFNWMILPLYCISQGKGDEVRSLLRYELDGFRVIKKLHRLIPIWYSYFYSLVHNFSFLSDPQKVIESFKQEIKNIELTSSLTEWASYANDSNYFLPFDAHNRWFPKQKNVFRVLRKLKPKTVLDFGANIGWYSELAAREGAKVMAVDIDEESLTKLYKRTKERQLNIQTAMVSFVMGTASNITWPAAAERFRSEMVLALALTHHLAFKDHIDFFTIIKELNNYTKKWLLVEFIPPDDKYIVDWIKPEHEWYKEENFVLALRKYFKSIEVFESYPSPRKLFFCEK